MSFQGYSQQEHGIELNCVIYILPLAIFWVLTTSVYGAGLSREEQMWLAQRINDHLHEQTGVKPPELPELKSFRSRPMQVGSGASLYGGSVWDRGSVMDSPGFWDDSLDSDD